MADAEGVPVAAGAVEHVAGDAARRYHRGAQATGATTVLLAASISALGVVGIPIALAAFVVTGRVLGLRRHARAIGLAARDPGVGWALFGRTLVGTDAQGREHRLHVTARARAALFALPAARVRQGAGDPGQPDASSIPPATDR